MSDLLIKVTSPATNKARVYLEAVDYRKALYNREVIVNRWVMLGTLERNRDGGIIILVRVRSPHNITHESLHVVNSSTDNYIRVHLI